MTVYTKNTEIIVSSFGKFRANKFLNNKSTLLKLLPPTEDAFLQHLKRSVLATTIDKIAKPIYPSLDYFGWPVKDGNLVPIQTTEPLWQNEKNVKKDVKGIVIVVRRMYPVILAVRVLDLWTNVPGQRSYHRLKVMNMN